MTSIEITKKGNAVGFTAKGETVTGRYSRRSRTWNVWIDGACMLTDDRTRRFATLTEAKAYAASLIDAVKTAELAWW